MTEIPGEIGEVPEPNEALHFESLEAARVAELEDVLSYIRQCVIDAHRFSAPVAVEHAFSRLAEDLRRGDHR